jgi:hypothetical protein
MTRARIRSAAGARRPRELEGLWCAVGDHVRTRPRPWGEDFFAMKPVSDMRCPGAECGEQTVASTSLCATGPFSFGDTDRIGSFGELGEACLGTLPALLDPLVRLVRRRLVQSQTIEPGRSDQFGFLCR